MIFLIINGKQRDIEACTVNELMTFLNLNVKKVVVEVNGNIVEPSLFNEFKVKEEDIIEVISFVGGG